MGREGEVGREKHQSAASRVPPNEDPAATWTCALTGFASALNSPQPLSLTLLSHKVGPRAIALGGRGGLGTRLVEHERGCVGKVHVL